MIFIDFLESHFFPFYFLLAKLQIFRYVIVQLASVISDSTRIHIRERAADKFRGIFYDPAGN